MSVFQLTDEVRAALPQELITVLERVFSPGTPGRTVVPGQDATVPRAKSPKATRVVPSTTGAAITLTWISPERDFDKISKYNLHVTTEDALTPTVYSAPTKSPWTFSVPLARSQKIIIQIQTVLWNGQVSDLEVSPTVSVAVTLAAGEDINAIVDAAIAAALPGIIADAEAAAIAAVTPLLDMNYIPAAPTTDILSFNLATDTASLLSTSTDGKLNGIGIRVLANITSGAGANTATITITNGAATTTIPIYSGSTVLNPALVAVISTTTSAGLTAGDAFFIPLGDSEFTGTTTVVASSTGQVANAGSIQVTLLYSTKL